MKRVTLAERGKRKRIKIQSHVLLILKFQVKGGNINVICDRPLQFHRFSKNFNSWGFIFVRDFFFFFGKV